MSRYYSISVNCIGKITDKELRKVMVKKFGWKKMLKRGLMTML
jgi:hypothetical protein